MSVQGPACPDILQDMPGLTGLVGSGGPSSCPSPGPHPCDTPCPCLVSQPVGRPARSECPAWTPCEPATSPRLSRSPSSAVPGGRRWRPLPEHPSPVRTHDHIYETPVRYSVYSRCCISVYVPSTTRINAECLVFYLDYFYLDFSTFFLIHTLLLSPTIFSVISFKVLGHSLLFSVKGDFLWTQDPFSHPTQNSCMQTEEYFSLVLTLTLETSTLKKNRLSWEDRIVPHFFQIMVLLL